MTSTSPSPSSSPSSSPVFPNPTPTSQPDQSMAAPPPLDTSSTSALPPQLPPPPVISPPPGIPPPPDISPPPPHTHLYASSPPPNMLPPPPVASPPPPPDTSPPPPPPVASPPPPDTSPPPPPVSPAPAKPSPATTKPSPPPVTAAPPDAPILSSPPPPPPSGGSPPPNTPAPPRLPTPPGPTPSLPHQPRSHSPPPPKIIPSPPASTSPPPPHSNPPKHSPPNQNLTPPPSTSSPPSNTSTTQTPPPLPSVKPTTLATEATTTSSQNVTSGGSPSRPKTGGVVAISLVAGFVTLSLFLMAVWFKRRQKRRNHPHNLNHIIHSPSTSSEKSDSQILRSHPLTGNSSLTNSKYSSNHGGVGNSRAWFTYEELAKATGGFSGSNLLGEGGFGCVYKGLLPDGREVAVKQLKIGGGQGEREFRAEVEIISRVHHRHLVSLVGYCISDHQRLLVYQFVSNNTLRYHLHGRPVMEWVSRIRVAAGAARGLAYLHEDCHPRIIHRDIKSSNILLDDNFDAQVADFGLAKLAMDSNTHVTTRVMGTFGYLAPEYASSGKLTEKSDVFSFGVVLLELITGRKPVDASQPMGEEGLVEWARPLINHALETEELEELVDPRLGKNYVRVEMFRMIEAAAACIRHLAPKRPRMSQVVRALDSIVECTTDLTNGMKVGESEIMDSREQSAQIRLFQRMAFDGQDYGSDYLNNSQTSWGS